MTTKEKLYLEILKLNNAIADLDESYTRRDIEKSLAYFNPSRYKVQELEESLDTHKRTLARVSHAKKVAEYYTTPEGQEYKAGINEMLATVEKNMTREVESMREAMREIISREIGDLWELKHFGDESIEIALCNNEARHVGRYITLYYGLGGFFEGTFHLDINYSAGNFDPVTSPICLKFIHAVATFADLCSRDRFRDFMREYAEKRKAQKIEHAHLRGMLENPPAVQ